MDTNEIDPKFLEKMNQAVQQHKVSAVVQNYVELEDEKNRLLAVVANIEKKQKDIILKAQAASGILSLPGESE